MAERKQELFFERQASDTIRINSLVDSLPDSGIVIVMLDRKRLPRFEDKLKSLGYIQKNTE
jgi:hypothetical protein